MRIDETNEKEKRKGNYKPGPGRPPGRKNNKTIALEQATMKAAEAVDEAFEGDAHAFLQAVYRNPKVPLEIRISAAGKALRVEKPVLSANRSNIDVRLNLAERLAAAQKRLLNVGYDNSTLLEGSTAVPKATPIASDEE